MRGPARRTVEHRGAPVPSLPLGPSRTLSDPVPVPAPDYDRGAASARASTDALHAVA